jgi:hypothetical protein
LTPRPQNKLAGVLEDEFGIAGLMAVELKAWLACDQGLKKGFALDELQARNVLAIKVRPSRAELFLSDYVCFGSAWTIGE